MTIRVLFVCLGNICRSPSAEGVFRQLVIQNGLQKQIDAESAGTGAWHVGNPPDERAQKVARERGFDISGLKARQVQTKDFDDFDLIIAMDQSNHADLLDGCPPHAANKISLLLSHGTTDSGDGVPDPYYGGEEGFHHMFDLIELGAQGLLDHVVRKHLN